MTKRMVLFDADVLAYRVSAASEERQLGVTHIDSGRVKVFKNKTAFKKFLKDNDFEYIESKYSFEEIQTPKPIDKMNPYAILDAQIKKVKEDVWADDHMLFISGEANFREYLPLPSKYKGKREGSIRPLQLKDCRNYLINSHGAKVVNGHETDDALIYMGYHYLKKGYEVIIVTNDKDANAYSGLSVYDYTQEKPEVKLIPELGSLYMREDGKVKGDGFLWYCCQMLTGDPVDCYKPTELAEVKFGDAGAYNLLKDCDSAQKGLQVVKNKYKEWYPEEFTYVDWEGNIVKADWKFILDLYHKCARMMSHHRDTLEVAEFFQQYGVELE